MVSDFKSIPIIDISPLLKKWDDLKSMASDPGVSQVVKQLDEACKLVGFFYVKGHGIPDSLVQEVKEMTRKFFDLPYDEKVKIKLSAMTGYRGYQKIRENITQGKPDMHEAIDFYKEFEPGMYGDLGKVLEGPNKWPANPSNYKSVMEEYLSRVTDLSKIIMRGVALALGGSPDEFGGGRAGDPFWIMRLLGYPGISNSKGSGILENDVGIEAHTDYGLLTLVNQDDEIPGLQVRSRSREWIWAVPIPGTFVCNIGDMVKIWSNGLYEPTWHRVINNSRKYRVSVAFFYEPNFDAFIEPLEFCKQKDGGIEKCESIVYGEHLVGKVITNFAV